MDGVTWPGGPRTAWPGSGVIRTFQHTSEFARLTVLENLLAAAPGQPGDSLGGRAARAAALRGRGSGNCWHRRGRCWRTSA